LWSNDDGKWELDFDTNPEVTIKIQSIPLEWFSVVIVFIVKTNILNSDDCLTFTSCVKVKLIF
jgi:hypothetical protein